MSRVIYAARLRRSSIDAQKVMHCGSRKRENDKAGVSISSTLPAVLKSLLVNQKFSFRFLFIHDQHSNSLVLILQNNNVNVNMHDSSLLPLRLHVQLVNLLLQLCDSRDHTKHAKGSKTQSKSIGVHFLNYISEVKQH